MIPYQVIGPTHTGDFLVAYPIPGAAKVMSVAATALSRNGADAECKRLNELSLHIEAAIKADMAARGAIVLDLES